MEWRSPETKHSKANLWHTPWIAACTASPSAAGSGLGTASKVADSRPRERAARKWDATCEPRVGKTREREREKEGGK